ncbi:MAG: hypothetical protein WDW38_009099 [Sanguina aurantia]
MDGAQPPPGSILAMMHGHSGFNNSCGCGNLTGGGSGGGGGGGGGCGGGSSSSLGGFQGPSTQEGDRIRRKVQVPFGLQQQGKKRQLESESSHGKKSTEQCSQQPPQPADAKLLYCKKGSLLWQRCSEAAFQLVGQGSMRVHAAGSTCLAHLAFSQRGDHQQLLAGGTARGEGLDFDRPSARFKCITSKPLTALVDYVDCVAASAGIWKFQPENGGAAALFMTVLTYAFK